MRRILTMLVVAALAAAVFAPVALAVDKQCSRLPCFGTDARDTLYERGGAGVPDDIRGLRYGDRIYTRGFGADRDVLSGDRGNDFLNSQDGDRRDTINGGPGYDECLVDRPIEVGTGCDVVGFAIE